MNIREAIIKKQQLEALVRAAIDMFEAQTGCLVQDITIRRAGMVGNGAVISKMVIVSTTVILPNEVTDERERQ